MTDSLSIGALATRTGLTVRTLHHYDAIGLLTPSGRTDAGHRRYGPDSVARLQQIVSLRALGFRLDAIATVLDRPDADPLSVIEQHVEILDARIAEEQRLRAQLQGLADAVRAQGNADLDTLLTTIQQTTMIEQHYTPEQLDRLKQRANAVGPERIAEVQQEWADLFAALDQHRQDGTSPSDPVLRPYAEKAESLIAEFTGGNAGIRQSLSNAVQDDKPAMYKTWGISPEAGDYYGRVMEAYHAA